MKPKRKFIRSVLADVCFVVGLAAVVVGIAAAGNWPLAICVAGAELVVTGVLIASIEDDDKKEG